MYWYSACYLTTVHHNWFSLVIGCLTLTAQCFCAGAEKLGINKEDITAVDEADGTEIDEYEMLLEMSASSTVIIILLESGQTWTKASTHTDTPAHRALSDRADSSNGSDDSYVLEKATSSSIPSLESKTTKRSESNKYSYCTFCH